MNFSLNDELLAVRDAARDFARNVLAPGVIERDKEARFPTQEIKALGELGFLGMMTSQDFGGGQMSTLAYVVAMEEIANVDASTAVVMSVNNSLVCQAIEKFGSEHQKEKYLKPLAQGSCIGAFCLSEPEAGSDATSQRTTAFLKDSKYVLNGVKNWITNGSTATYYIVFAQSDPQAGHRGINAFIVEQATNGFSVGAKEDKMGIRASDTHSLHFDGVEVPIGQRLGEDGEGFKIAMSILAGGRIGIAAQAIGIAAGALELSIQYAKQRTTFGKPISQHQAIAFKLADMATQIDAARLLVYQAAMLKDAGKDYSRASAQAKLMASQVAMDVTTEAVQIHGGYGYVREYHVERMMRDAKITQIYEGTSEIQRIVIGRDLLK